MFTPAVRNPGSKARIVMLAGITVGTAVLVLAVWDGARLRLGGMPGFFGLIFGTLLLWLIIIAAVTIAAALLAKFGQALAEVLGQVLTSLAGTAGRTVTSLYERARQWAGHRWDKRQPDPGLNDAQRQRDRDGMQGICAACGRAGTADDPLVIRQGYRVHHSHTVEPGDGFYDHSPSAGDTTVPGGVSINDRDPQQHATATAAPPISQKAETTMASPTTQAPRTGAPAGWKGLAAATADFEPDSDGELLDWMAGEVAGMGAYGEALVNVYEHCVESKGLDPASMSCMHDTADAVADAAQAMAYARQKFAAVYEAVREAVSNGLVLPHDGRWITGEGEA